MLKVNIELSEIGIEKMCQMFTALYDNGKVLAGNL
jgi:hypothetical protein